MASTPILPHFSYLEQLGWRAVRLLTHRNRDPGPTRPSPLCQDPDRFPSFVRQSPVAMRYWRFLSPLA